MSPAIWGICPANINPILRSGVVPLSGNFYYHSVEKLDRVGTQKCTHPDVFPGALMLKYKVSLSLF